MLLFLRGCHILPVNLAQPGGFRDVSAELDRSLKLCILEFKSGGSTQDGSVFIEAVFTVCLFRFFHVEHNHIRFTPCTF